MKIYIIFGLVLISLFLMGQNCEEESATEVNRGNVEKIIVCDKPYITDGNSCCLDANNNNICDKDEETVVAEPEEAEEIEAEIEEEEEEEEEQPETVPEEETIVGEYSGDFDLKYFPEMFIGTTNKGEKALDGVIVVGRDAPSMDVITAGKIATETNGLLTRLGYIIPSTLDDEIDIKTTNAILIGQPCKNKATAEIVEDDSCTYGLDENQAIILLKKKHNNYYLILIGYTEEDARKGAEYLSKHIRGIDVDLDGVEVILDTSRTDAERYRPGDLINYPAPFLENCVLNGEIVVGETSPTDDVIGSIDIATRLQYVCSPKKATVGAAVLASEISDVAAQNIISIGNPCVNSVTAEVVGTSTDCDLFLNPGEAIIKLYDQPNKKVTIVIYGSNGIATRRATRVLANYEDYDLKGTETYVYGTSLTDITIKNSR